MRVAVVDAQGRIALKPIDDRPQLRRERRSARRRRRPKTSSCSIRPIRSPTATRWRSRRRQGRSRAKAARRKAAQGAAMTAARALAAARWRVAARPRATSCRSTTQARGRHAGRVEARGAVARGHAERRRAQRARGGSASAIRSSTRWSQKALAGSPTLAAANARLAQARALATRGLGRPLSAGQSLGARAAQRAHLREPPADAATARPTSRRCRTTSCCRSASSYEADLFGRVQSTIEGARASRRAVRGRPREHAPRARPPISPPRISTCARSTPRSTC